MNGEPLSREVAEKVYDILVDTVLADDLDRQYFVRLQSTEHVTEYRFCGALGFGGKFWRSGGRWYINCYPESETADRKCMIERANEKLQQLMLSCQ